MIDIATHKTMLKNLKTKVEPRPYARGGWVLTPPPLEAQKVKIHTISGEEILPHLYLDLPLTKNLIVNILLSKKITIMYFLKKISKTPS